MALTSLDAVRQWCNADDIGGVDDERLQFMVDAAEDYVITATGRTKDEILKMGDGVNLPPQLTAAICSLAADWYDYREGSSTQERKPTQVFTAIIKQFRKLADSATNRQKGGAA